MSNQISGTDITVALYDENVTYGVPPLTPFNGRIAYVSKCNVSAERGWIESPIITGGRGVRRPGVGNTAVGGVIETTLAPETIGFWLKHMLSAPTTTGASAPYIHVFRPGALPIGFTLQKSYIPAIASKVEQFTGCRISSADFSFNQEQFATLSMNVLGKSHSVVAAALDATLDDTGHAGWSGFEGKIRRGGTLLGGVVSATMKVDNAMPGGPYTFGTATDASGLRSGNPEGRCKISGTLEVVFQNFNLLDSALNQDDVALDFIYTRGTGAGTAGNEIVTISLSHSLFDYLSPPLETESGIMLSLNYNVFAPAASDYSGLQVTLLNAIPAASI